jgi:p38 MAP kinase
MLIFNPYGQISASGALTAPYLVSCHEPTDEPVARELFYETFDGDHGSDDSWKQKLHVHTYIWLL